MLKTFESRLDPNKPGRARGLTEIAEALDFGLRTVEKRRAFGKAYLIDLLNHT